MSNDTLELDRPTRAVIDNLEASDRERLEALIQQAAKNERQMLAQALTDAMQMVPRPLRNRVRKLFLG